MRLPARCEGASKKRFFNRNVESRRTSRSTRWKNRRRKSVAGGKLAGLFDIALPPQQRRGLQGAVFMAVIDGVEPVPQTLVELLEG